MIVAKVRRLNFGYFFQIMFSTKHVVSGIPSSSGISSPSRIHSPLFSLQRILYISSCTPITIKAS